MPTSVLHLHRHRLLVQRLVARRLAIPFAGSDIVFRFPQVPLVRDIRDDLTLAENAFMFGQPALEGDIFQILWRCHPLFMRPDGSQPNQPSGGRRVSMLRRVRAWFERRALLAHVRQCDIAGAAQANLTNKLLAARFSIDAAAAESELNLREGIRRAYARGGTEGVYANFKFNDPIVLDQLIQQFATQQSTADKTNTAIQTINATLQKVFNS